jgi:hypothetical protein
LIGIDETHKRSSLRKIIAVAIIASILGIAALAAGYYSFPSQPNYCTLSGLKETKITFVDSPTGNKTSVTVYENRNWTASYEQGKTLTLTESLFTTSRSGVTLITNIVSNTPGIVFESSSLTFPAVVPYASNSSEANKKIELIFKTADVAFSGVFEYTIYYSLTTSQ